MKTLSNILIGVSFCILFYNSVEAQTVNKLDDKYGFKNFKLGTSPSYYMGLIKKENTDNENKNISVYEYTGNKKNYLFFIDVDAVELYFFKNKLMSIFISFKKNFNETDYNLILSSLQNIYGEGFDCIVNNNSKFTLSTGRIWTGKKVKMNLQRYYYNNSFWSGFLSLDEISLLTLMKSNEF